MSSTELYKRKIVKPGKDGGPLSDIEIENLRSQAPAWRIIKEAEVRHLRRKFSFTDFVAGLNFTNKIGELAEENEHHPRIVLEYDFVEIDWWTHSVDGLHLNDFILAARTDAVYDMLDHQHPEATPTSEDDNRVTEASKESFPASDAPNWRG